MTDNDKPVEVIQADRDAAAAYWFKTAENEDIVQAFARHRLNTTVSDEAVKALEPFAAMGRALEARATFSGMSISDSQVVCGSSGEAGMGVLTMGHFRDAAAVLPEAPGWGGVYRPPFDRATLQTIKGKWAMSDEEAMSADLYFEECATCAGTGADDDGHDCPDCKGLGTIEIWSPQNGLAR